MKFGPVPVAEAVGGILAHSIAAGRPPYEQSRSYKIKKGTVLTRQHLKDLTALGHDKVVVAQLEQGDVHEDVAARQLAAALVPDPSGQGIVVGRAGTGRVNLTADHAGIVELDADALVLMNSINPMVTVATVPPWQRVVAGQMLATVKIISYAVHQDDLARACDAVAGAMRVRRPEFESASLIETRLLDAVPKDKGRKAMQTRLNRFGVRLTERAIAAHDPEALAQALQTAKGEVLMILTASATSDVADVAPEAVRLAGGQVIQFGMPVDPGNLLFVGDLSGKPVIGLPGCARSLSMNGADWVLERILCGVPIRPKDLAAMGVGGLLKDIPQRGLPRDAKV